MTLQKSPGRLPFAWSPITPGAKDFSGLKQLPSKYKKFLLMLQEK